MLRAATIEFDGGAIDCILRNLSRTGAMLDVASPIGIPPQFNLVLGEGHLLPCRIVWRKPNRIGVEFE
jgi:hypothetical protein